MIVVGVSDYYISAMHVTFNDHVFRICRLSEKRTSLSLPITY